VRDARYVKKKAERIGGQAKEKVPATDVQIGNSLRMGLVSPAWQTYGTQDSFRLGYSSWLRNEMF